MIKIKALAPIFALFGFATITVAENLTLEEIVVTVQKREQNLQDVPVAVTAVTAENIDAMGIVNTADLTRASASLSYGQGPTPNSSVFRVRGIGTSVVSIGIESSVAVVIDDVAQAQPGQAMSNLVDIERIEILRGPQSTLYGKNASAGLLNVVTKSPTEEFEGFLETTLTDDHELKVTGAVSGPLTPALAYRVAAYYRDYDGWAENVATGEDINGAEEKGIRGKLAWQPVDKLDFLMIGHHYETDSNCCDLSHRELDPSARLFGFAPVTTTNPYAVTNQGKNNTDPEVDVEAQAETADTSSTLQINWIIGELELMSISSYNKWENATSSDLDFSSYPIFENIPFFSIDGGVVSDSEIESDFFTQELRLRWQTGDRFDHLLGLYYGDIDTDRRTERNFTPIEYRANATTKNAALFGEVTWRLHAHTQLTLGGRYNREDISVDFNDLRAEKRYQAEDSEGRWLGKVALQHFLNEDIMLFTSAAKGYKGQGYDISPSFDQRAADNPVQSEDSRSFEVGVKSSLFENLLQLDVVGFYAQTDDYQAQNSEVIDGELVFMATNVGKLETKGLEIDANFLLGQGLLLNSSIAWIDAAIDEYPDADCYRDQTLEQGCLPVAPGSYRFAQDLSGKPLNNSPDWKITVGARYFQPLENMPFDGFFNLNYRWQDEVLFDLKQNPGTVQESYGVLNISAGIRERSRGQYQATVFVNNVLDEDYASSIIDVSSLYRGDAAYMHLVPRNAQRYVGFRLKYLL